MASSLGDLVERNHHVFPGFQDAYLCHLESLRTRGIEVSGSRGTSSLEHLSQVFRIANPRRRLITCPARKANLAFCFGEVLWYLAGRDDRETLEYYAPSIGRFYYTPSRAEGAAGTALVGTGYGPSIFGPVKGVSSQWDGVVAALREDMGSKRAFIVIARPEEDRSLANPDVSCTMALQFLLRPDGLHMVTYMRAVDAYFGCVTDVFSFTFLQELLARQLGVPLGTYTHFIGSHHLFGKDYRRADVLLSQRNLAVEISDRMPAMPTGDNWAYVHEVMQIEEQLRTNRLRLGSTSLSGLGLPLFWTHVVAVLELYRQTRFGMTGSVRELSEMLPNNYRVMMYNRFPALRH
ncbi:thymidylate synthase [Streptomyces sp. NPDC050658]|uniref:thymidylate synthase n=1 Tax=unclassified Streptomyces TaxID=2593676 RepID=UPI00342DA461